MSKAFNWISKHYLIIFIALLAVMLFFIFKPNLARSADDRASETFDSQVISVVSTATQFPAVTTGLTFTAPARIHVIAPDANTQSVWIGKSSVTSTPSGAVLTELRPGEIDVLPISDRTLLYHIAVNDSQKLIIVYLPTGH